MADDQRWYYFATFLAIVGLESIPRFLFEVGQPLLLVQRLVLLILFFLVAWFFAHALHEEFKWSILSGMFFLDALVAVTLALLLFLQLYSAYFVYIALFVLGARAIIYSYLVSRRLPHLRALVFCSCAFLLIAGEAIMLASRLPPG